MTLVELMVSCSLSLMILISTIATMSVIHHSSLDLIKRQDDLMQLACAQSLLVRDLNELSSAEIISCQAACIITQKNTQTCTWYLREGRLMRSYGYYDRLGGKFTSYASSMIADSIHELRIKACTAEDRIVGIECMAKSTFHNITCCIALRGCI